MIDENEELFCMIILQQTKKLSLSSCRSPTGCHRWWRTREKRLPERVRSSLSLFSGWSHLGLRTVARCEFSYLYVLFFFFTILNLNSYCGWWSWRRGNSHDLLRNILLDFIRFQYVRISRRIIFSSIWLLISSLTIALNLQSDLLCQWLSSKRGVNNGYFLEEENHRCLLTTRYRVEVALNFSHWPNC